MRTQSAFYADTAHGGGWIFYNAISLFGAFLGTTISANMALTRNALGDYSFNRTAAGAEVYLFPIGLANLKRLLEPAVSANGLPFQTLFGTAAGGIGYPAGAPGLPPFSGSTELTQPTAAPAKGIQVTDVAAVYRVGVADLTAASVSCNRSVWANNVAISITNVPVDAAALPKTSAGDATGPYVVTRAVTTPAFEITDTSDLNVEWSFTMANTGTFRLYGLGFHVNFNHD